MSDGMVEVPRPTSKSSCFRYNKHKNKSKKFLDVFYVLGTVGTSCILRYKCNILIKGTREVTNRENIFFTLNRLVVKVNE